MKITDIKNPLLIFNTKSPKDTYLSFVTKYHPDKHINNITWSTEITAKINFLFNSFKDLESIAISDNLSTLDLLYIRFYNVYKEYIYRDKVVFVFTDSTVFSNIKKNIEKYKKTDFIFKSSNMETEFKHILPDILISDNKITIKKSMNSIPLEFLFNYYSNKLDDKTVAWIISRMLNFACYLQYNNSVYASFSLRNLYVNTEKHWLKYIGGWWNYISENDSFSMMDSDVISCIPKSLLKTKKDTKKIDLYIIKALALKLLGNPMAPERTTNIPKAFCEWLVAPPLDNAILEFKSWDKALIDSYGKRKFVDITTNNIEFYNIEIKPFKR